MSKPSLLYAVFVGLVVLATLLATVPIVASDLFQQPYSPLWPVIHRTTARLQIEYNPPGGGAPPKLPQWRDPGDARLYFRDVALHTADGLGLQAWYVPAAEPAGPTVVLCHGLLDSKWWMLGLMPWLHDAGYHVLTFDFRGHGGSDKQPVTVGRKEVLDVQAALNWLVAEGIGDRVAGLGMSMGAAALVNTAAVDDRLDALVLDSLFAEWENVNYAEDYRLPPEWLVPGVPDPVDLIRNVEVPVFIIHGTADILTHVDHAERLHAAANDPKALWINDSGHAWSSWTYPVDYERKVLAFLERLLPDGARAEGGKAPLGLGLPPSHRMEFVAEAEKPLRGWGLLRVRPPAEVGGTKEAVWHIGVCSTISCGRPRIVNPC